MPGDSSMRMEVERALAQVPAGRVTTYGDIARALGDIRAARAVGELLSTNRFPERVPCHRVVMADGALGGYAFGGAHAKARRLRAEGVEVRDDHVANLDAVAMRDLSLSPIFVAFAKRQAELAARVATDATARPPKVAVGVDASYAKADERAFAAAVAVDLNTKEAFASAVVEFEPPLPYVPGYLAFRELPGVVAAVRALPAEARRRAVLLVDGQGILHPRRCGIASMAGLELSMPSVGAAKGKLVGTVAKAARRLGPFEARQVKIDGEVRGLELAVPEAREALYVSPGTGLSVAQAAKLAADLTHPGEESPLPILRADALSRSARAAGQAPG